MTKNLVWTRAEICKLFSVVEEYKKQNKPLLSAFRDFAARFARRPASVRNFYYQQLKIFQDSPNLCQDWGIDLDKHQKKPAAMFTKQELATAMAGVENLVQKGHSVRGACKIVSNGDATTMLRLQNKYHAQKAAQNPKVLVMPTKTAALSDGEINSLLLGLIKLVRKSAEDAAQRNVAEKIRLANTQLRASIKNLADKQREVQNLREKFEILTTEKEKLREEIQKLRSQNVELVKTCAQSKKLSGLKEYIGTLQKQ
ncbi:MAG: hypothetical protein IKK20_01645 [Clostridia bacterium]|nr:hypothetical protein [Clostridia bacterium]MBR2433807.1 hypothetical protein [Clostridia bacterium]MBR3790489.1 hypothetical protein [Clostridia bacterium]